MERVGTLINKLQQQLGNNASTHQLLQTVQILHTELLHLQIELPAGNKQNVAVVMPHPIFIAQATKDFSENCPAKTVEILQIDESEIEAELQELKQNAATFTKISAQNKPHILFDADDELPTLAHYPGNGDYLNNSSVKKETITEALYAVETKASLNDKLKQPAMQLSDTITESPIRDLKKAIDINDRFLFINELFRGDEAMYERSIKTINGFAILPEAEYWIQRELKVKIGWRENNEVVKQFNQLVKRRFS